MSAISLGYALPWTTDETVEQRFANILVLVLVPFIVLSILMPLLPLFESDEPEPVQVPDRIAKLVIERKKEPPPPPPKPEPEPKQPEKKPEKPNPKAEPQPTPKPEQTREAARAKAEKAGVMAFADDLASLRNNSAVDSVRANRKLSQGVTANTNQRKLITSDLGEGSTGIRSEAGAPGKLGGGTELAGRSTTRVSGPPGGGEVSGGQGRSGVGSQARRSIEDIQVVFDRNKSSLFALYQRALRKNPTLQGTLVLKLTIQPSGKVSSVSVVSSELDDPQLEQKIVNRVKLFDFGAKDVPVWRDNYPIKFFPS